MIKIIIMKPLFLLTLLLLVSNCLGKESPYVELFDQEQLYDVLEGLDMKRGWSLLFLLLEFPLLYFVSGGAAGYQLVDFGLSVANLQKQQNAVFRNLFRAVKSTWGTFGAYQVSFLLYVMQALNEGDYFISH